VTCCYLTTDAEPHSSWVDVISRMPSDRTTSSPTVLVPARRTARIPWSQIFPQIARNLIDEQTDDGLWPLGTGNEGKFSSTYTTSLAVLALSPAYQLLPIYQR